MNDPVGLVPPEQIAPVEPKRSWFGSHKAFVSILVLLMIAGGASTYYFMSAGKVDQTSLAPVTHKEKINPTVGWKTYTNSKYGFEFKYPKEWTANDGADGIVSLSYPGLGNAQSTSENLNDLVNMLIVVDKNANPKQLTIRQWFDEYKKAFPSNTQLITDQNTILNGINSVEIERSIVIRDMIEDFVPRGTDIFDIGHPNSEKYNTIYRQILSTFKFTSDTSVDTSTWKTYTNSKYGFEFKYPTDYFNRGVKPSTNTQLFSASRTDGSPVITHSFDIIVGDNAPVNKDLLGNAKKIQIGGQTGYQYETHQGPYSQLNTVAVILGNKIIWISAGDGVDAKQDPTFLSKIQSPFIHSSTFDQILSTFKFTNQKAIVNADVTKIADFATIRVTAELYYEKFKKYPKAEGNTPESRWQSFSTAVVNEKFFPNQLPQDPRRNVTGFSYDYQTDSTQQNAVFKATLEAPDDTSVQGAVEGSGNTVSGTIYGIVCNKPNYCVLSKHRQ